MATTNLLNQVRLENGDESAEVTIAESSERVNLRFQSVQLGSANSQARLVVVDDQTRVKATVVVDGSGTKEVEIERIDGVLTLQVACNLGVCRVTLDELTGVEGSTGEGAGGLSSADLADDSVTTAKLAALAVTTAKLAALGVTTAKIAALAVTEAKIGALAVTTAKINALAVTDAELAALAVTTAKIAGGAVDPAKWGLSGIKTFRFTGRSGAGDITLTGAAIGDRVLSIFGVVTGLATTVVGGTDFESVITVTDKIQQSLAGDLSTNDYVVILIPAAV